MLTLGQRRTYDFIKKFIETNDYAPTAAEIAAGIGIKSRGVVHRYLKALVAANKIQLAAKKHRNITLVNQFDVRAGVPLLGAIAAGQPIEAIEESECIDISSIFLGDQRYALKVCGDSMIDEGIFDGDIVICEHADSAVNGQIVVALIDQQEATLKRFERKNAKVILHPANERLAPMVFDPAQVTIQGIYIGLLRTSW